MELLLQIAEQAPKYLEAIAQIIGGFALVAAITPTKRDDSIVGKITKIVDFLGANFGAAKNKND